ncbi:hypothetical protein, partial [Dactylosporangium roseum]
SDVDDDARADDYDPIARAAAGGKSPTTEGDDMTPDQAQQFDDMQWRLDAVFANVPAVRGGRYMGKPLGVNKLYEHLAAIDTTLAQLQSADAASAQREQDMLNALKALAQGGTSIDTAAVLARIDQRTADVTGLVEQLQAENAELRAQVARATEAAIADLSPAERAALDGNPDN